MRLREIAVSLQREIAVSLQRFHECLRVTAGYSASWPALLVQRCWLH